MNPDPRRAIVERRDEIATQPRPAKLSHVDLAAEVAQVRETDDLYRVYRREWIVAHVEDRLPGDDERTAPMLMRCKEHFAAKYAGRVHPDDVAYECLGGAPHDIVQLKLRLPNLKGEFKTEALARAYVHSQVWLDAMVVARNSREDHTLRGYGIKKLSSAP